MIDLVITHLTHPWGPPWTLETLGDLWRPLATMPENGHFGHFDHLTNGQLQVQRASFIIIGISWTLKLVLATSRLQQGFVLQASRADGNCDKETTPGAAAAETVNDVSSSVRICPTLLHLSISGRTRTHINP